MNLKDYIHIKENFYSSINISYDIGNQYMIDNYIPTRYSIDIIEDILLSLNKDSKDRARILIGPYGKGKSHILLIVLSILSKVDNTEYTKLINNIKDINLELANYIELYLMSKNKFLPVIIEKNYDSLEQSFLYALNESLKLNNLSCLMPDTFYTSAIDTIKMWENNYKDTYNKFVKIIDTPIYEFINGLKSFNIDCYTKFKEIYPLLTSGSEFDPFLNISVIDHYIEVNKKIKDYGYTGIFIVYDEFSKYLESSIDKISYSDLKLLQDFAELCNRTKDNQIHLTLVTHKNILNYVNKQTTKEKLDGWKAISGRFKHTYIKTDTYKEMYQLISSAIEVDETYIDKNFNNIKLMKEKLLKSSILNKIYAQEQVDLKYIIMDCFPLHPLTTYMLPRISIKLGQNERTLFSFLTGKDNNSVLTLLNKSRKSNIITPSELFDYFEVSILESNYKLKPYKSYRLAKKVIDKNARDQLCIDILKLLVLIYIIDEYEHLAPTRENVVSVMCSLGYLQIDIEKKIEYLISCNSIFHQISNDYLIIKEDNGVNLEEKISSQTEKIKSKKSIDAIFNEVLINKYIYPLRYNSNYEITRYFSIDFISAKDYLKTDNWNSCLKESEADGRIYIILGSSQKEIELVKSSLKKMNKIDDRIIFVLNKSYNEDIFIIYRFYAVLQLMEKIKDDDLLYEEYRMYLSDLQEIINRILNSFLMPELKESIYINKNKFINIDRKSELTSLLSDICEKNYYLTPVINNETINKNYLSTTAFNSRNRLLDAILNNDLNEEDLGLEGNRQEVSIMRSTLIQTGLLKNVKGKSVLDLNVKDHNMNNLIKHIEDFILDKKKEGKRSFEQLYNIFLDSEHNIGMKTGSIPIYIAVVLRVYKKDLIISSEDKELDVSAELLENINSNPDKYFIENLYWDKDKIIFLENLWQIFKEYSYFNSDDYNKISNITDAMTSWYMSLSKFAKDSLSVPYIQDDKILFKKLNSSNKEFLDSLKLDIVKPRDYIFNKLPLILNNFDLFSLAKDVENIVNYYNSLDKLLIETLKKYLKINFSEQYNAKIDYISLTSLIKDWMEKLKGTTKNHVFSGIYNSIMNLFINIDQNENKFVYDLGRVVTGLRLEDWDCNIIEVFLEKIQNFKEDILSFDSKAEESISSTSVYKLQIGRDNDIKTYKKVEYDGKGKLLYNQIKSSLNMMGQAISEDEKRQVLLDILIELS